MASTIGINSILAMTEVNATWLLCHYASLEALSVGALPDIRLALLKCSQWLPLALNQPMSTGSVHFGRLADNAGLQAEVAKTTLLDKLTPLAVALLHHTHSSQIIGAKPAWELFLEAKCDPTEPCHWQNWNLHDVVPRQSFLGSALEKTDNRALSVALKHGKWSTEQIQQAFRVCRSKETIALFLAHPQLRYSMSAITRLSSMLSSRLAMKNACKFCWRKATISLPCNAWTRTTSNQR